jgi:hypothetical protein
LEVHNKFSKTFYVFGMRVVPSQIVFWFGLFGSVLFCFILFCSVLFLFLLRLSLSEIALISLPHFSWIHN